MAVAVSLVITVVGVTLSAAGEIALLTVIVVAALATDSPGQGGTGQGVRARGGTGQGGTGGREAPP
jgi:hypothetical protein